MFANADALFDDLFCLMESAGIMVAAVEGPKVRFYARNRLLIDGKNHRLLSVKSGGANPHPFVECTGRASRVLGCYLREYYRHRPVRIDHAIDRRRAGLFDELHDYARAMCAQYRLKLGYGGDWSTPDAGRTIYIGSRKSQVCIRIYEKGLKYAHDLGEPVTDELREWVRLEVEFKPQTDAAKALALTVEGPQLWGATNWSMQLAEEVLAMATEAISIRERRESNRERALRFMGSQYSSHLRALLQECNGDLREFGEAVAQYANLMDDAQAA